MTTDKDVEALRGLAFMLTPDQQFRLATFIAENLGYVLRPEDNSDPLDRLEKLERKVAALCPDKSNEV